MISPFERERNDTISLQDTPHVLSAAFVYELPYGPGKKHLSDPGVASALLGGWQVSTIFRYSSALPMFFRVNGTACNLPGQFSGPPAFPQSSIRMRCSRRTRATSIRPMVRC